MFAYAASPAIQVVQHCSDEYQKRSVARRLLRLPAKLSKTNCTVEIHDGAARYIVRLEATDNTPRVTQDVEKVTAAPAMLTGNRHR